MATKRQKSSSTGALARWLTAIRDFFVELTSSYHPERHYMRGGRTGGAA